MRGFAKSAVLSVSAAALLVVSIAGPAAAAPPDDGAIYARPANITFQYINLDDSYVDDAAGQYTSDAWDGMGYFTLYPQNPANDTSGSVAVEFPPGSCQVTGTWDEAASEYVGTTVATCTDDFTVGGTDFEVTLVRTFQGSWARWELSASREFGPGDLFARFDGELGSDTETCYYAEDDDRENLVSGVAVVGPADIPCPSVSTIAEPSDPVLYVNTVKPIESVSGLSNGTDTQFYEFPVNLGATPTFVYSSAVVDYVVGSEGGFQCALNTALALTGSDFGSVLDGCMPRPVPDPTQLPPSWFQAYGRNADAACEAGWKPSWAQWPNDGRGGFVCEREEYWDTAKNGWAFRSVASSKG